MRDLFDEDDPYWRLYCLISDRGYVYPHKGNLENLEAELYYNPFLLKYKNCWFIDPITFNPMKSFRTEHSTTKLDSIPKLVLSSGNG